MKFGKLGISRHAPARTHIYTDITALRDWYTWASCAPNTSQIAYKCGTEWVALIRPWSCVCVCICLPAHSTPNVRTIFRWCIKSKSNLTTEIATVYVCVVCILFYSFIHRAVLLFVFVFFFIFFCANFPCFIRLYLYFVENSPLNLFFYQRIQALESKKKE